jgi:hypothetical protein
MVRKIFILGMLLAFAACGASSRTKALRVGLVSVNTARDSTVQFSKARESQIVDAATSKEDGQAKLAAWRASVDAVMAALDVAQKAIYDAAILNDAKSASEAGAAIVKALALAKELK